MSFNIVKKKHGSVVLVEKFRDEQGKVKEKYITSVGVMGKTEFLEFRKMINSLPQNERLRYCQTHQKEYVPKVSVLKKKKQEPSKVISKERRGYKSPKQTQEEFKEQMKLEKLRRSVEEDKKTQTEMMMERERKKLKTYTIKELTKVQKYEAEIINIKVEMNKTKKQLAKTKGLKKRIQLEKANREQIFMIKERHGKIKDILGEKYKSGKEVAKAYEKGKVNII